MLTSILTSSVLAGVVASKLAYLDPGSGSYLIQLLIAASARRRLCDQSLLASDHDLRSPHI